MGLLHCGMAPVGCQQVYIAAISVLQESFRLTASRVARDKPWSTLCKKSHGIPSSPRAAAVAKFRLLTGHDCLCAHLFRFNLVTSPICVLCDTGQDMTTAHLDECSALNDLNCIDEAEKLAYQLNEEAERTERPIRRLSKMMYGSTCADMQVDVMGECLSSIKHVVGTTSGCFYPRSNYWEVGGRTQCDKCGCRVRNSSSIVSRLWRQFQTTGTAIRGFSSGRSRGTTPADDRYIVLQARRNRRQTAGEIARHTAQVTGRPISRFTVATRLHGGGLFARRPVRCVPLTPAHRRRHSLWCREHRNWRDNEWGRVLFTDESRFSLSSDSHRILIWRERGSRNHPSNIIERDRYGGHGVLIWEASCLVVVQTFTSSTQVQSTGPVIVTRFFFHMCVFLEALWVCSSFSWTTMHHVIAQ
ncbi:HTH_Tnp_Tc3_2 domain-containing protein [Trichonephila clavipes]|nr:HTH_Tnp_Tc3_2 domain-containing protein [Trichonephila clavipes]